MSKNKILAACILTCALMMTSTAKAESYFIDKLSQGMANIAFGFIEIPKNVINITSDQNIFLGLTWGVIRGIVHGVSRTLVGGVEVITSPVPSGEFASPAYVWNRFSEDSRYFGLHYPGYWTSYGPLDDGE
ncbi:MAG: exosortase system-associated protein, TIGR04073 family [Nitrosomonas sp.]|uniref:exosortase system-associated protein, TIGR04073 family n=1 Tax=Nitrosomonas sp. TaxID=42353 RepID=UPI0032EDE51C